MSLKVSMNKNLSSTNKKYNRYYDAYLTTRPKLITYVNIEEEPCGWRQYRAARRARDALL